MIDVETYGAAVGAAKKYTDEHSGGGSSDAVKYTEQDLTSEQQAQARENIGAAASDDIPTDAVKYTAQTLTDAQKTQARTNIGAGTSDFSGSYGDLTNAPPLAKGGGTGGNIVGGTGVNQNSTKYTNSVAYGAYAGAITDHSLAFGNYAFAGTNYGGKHAVAIGYDARAERDYTFAYGQVVSASHNHEVVFGKYNVSNADTAFSIGDGTSSSDRHNLMELKTDGRMFLNGNEVALKIDYSTTEQDTGIKWVDGKSIYQKTYVFDPPVAGGGANYVSVADVSGLSIDTLISISGVQHDQGGNYIMSLEAYSNVGDNMYLRADKSAVEWKGYYLLDWMTIKYTKVTT
jgi:hypothetical protein